ncbi:hypothetical protein OGM63_19400 [Plectonema radiosum NIES-515]|uniref:Uncharacterized protein n=1 Tax=Plectonema radiosum NIES-515 TaxID=2986073 RepID=A0ABT3B2Q8_9CYAN|nr:hypothetical protein [Plectonema radiosum]MCV3215651.1 hypothetical protein [Plectonema radiosum NIES-515]
MNFCKVISQKWQLFYQVKFFVLMLFCMECENFYLFQQEGSHCTCTAVSVETAVAHGGNPQDRAAS